MKKISLSILLLFVVSAYSWKFQDNHDNEAPFKWHHNNIWKQVGNRDWVESNGQLSPDPAQNNSEGFLINKYAAAEDGELSVDIDLYDENYSTVSGGVVFRYTDNSNYYFFKVTTMGNSISPNGANIKLELFKNSLDTPIETLKEFYWPNPEFNLTIKMDGENFTFSCSDGKGNEFSTTYQDASNSHGNFGYVAVTENHNASYNSIQWEDAPGMIIDYEEELVYQAEKLDTKIYPGNRRFIGDGSITVHENQYENPCLSYIDPNSWKRAALGKNISDILLMKPFEDITENQDGHRGVGFWSNYKDLLYGEIDDNIRTEIENTISNIYGENDPYAVEAENIWNHVKAWIPNIYQLPDNKNELIGFTHIELTPDGSMDDPDCFRYYAIGISYSNDYGNTWTYCGEAILTHARKNNSNPDSDEMFNIGGVPYITVEENHDDFFYAYYNEWTIPQNSTEGEQHASVARARISEIVNNARSIHSTGIHEYNREEMIKCWSKLGKNSTDDYEWQYDEEINSACKGADLTLITQSRGKISLPEGSDDMHSDAAIFNPTGKFLLIRGSGSGAYLISSEDGLNWEDEHTLRTFQEFRLPFSSFISTADNASSDCNTIGSESYLYYHTMHGEYNQYAPPPHQSPKKFYPRTDLYRVRISDDDIERTVPLFQDPDGDLIGKNCITITRDIPEGQYMAEDGRIAALNSNDELYVKEGIAGEWIPEHGQVHDFMIDEKRIAVLTGNDNTLKIKEGGLSAIWKVVDSDVDDFIIDGNRIAVLKDGVLKLTEDALSSDLDWTTVHGSVQDFMIRGDMIAVIVDNANYHRALKVKWGIFESLWAKFPVKDNPQSDDRSYIEENVEDFSVGRDYIIYRQSNGSMNISYLINESYQVESLPYWSNTGSNVTKMQSEGSNFVFLSDNTLYGCSHTFLMEKLDRDVRFEVDNVKDFHLNNGWLSVIIDNGTGDNQMKTAYIGQTETTLDWKEYDNNAHNFSAK